MSKSAAPQPQPLPSQKIITLLESQIDASQQENHTNGTYTVNLKEQLVLNDGDSIGVKSAFIDTTATNSTFIRVLPEESEVTITHGLYFSDSQGVSKANPRAMSFFGYGPRTPRYRYPDSLFADLSQPPSRCHLPSW